MTLTIATLPGPLQATEDAAWSLAGDALTGVAGPSTDMFVDPSTGSVSVNAPRLLVTPDEGDFQLHARVEVAFGSTFDAGVLLLWVDDRTWAKLCFEYSPQGKPMVVTVVTRGLSDDANSYTVDGNVVWLRVARLAGAYAFHASLDGSHWDFVRHFSLGDVRPEVGFEVQSPTGPGLTGTFTGIAYRAESLADLRDGS